MPKLHEFETSSGYTLRYRVLALDVHAQITAAVRAEWAEGDDPARRPPVPPTVEIETGPGQVEAKVNDTHPDHLNALAAYDRTVSDEVSRRTLRLIGDYAIVCEVDQDAVAAHRAALAAIGVTYPDTSDRDLFLWHIAIPDSEEQQTLSGRIFGSHYAAWLEAQRRAFRRSLEGSADRVLEISPR